MTFTASPTRLAERLGAIVGEVIVRVMSRVRFTTEFSHPVGVLMPAAMARIVAAWLARRRGMILALMARIQAGKPPSPRPSRNPPIKQGPIKQGGARAPKPKLPPELRLRRGFGWLCGLADEVRDQGVWLRELLAEPAMRDMVLATPRLARLLSPLLHALGELKPDWMVAGAGVAATNPGAAARVAPGTVPAPHPHPDPSPSRGREKEVAPAAPVVAPLPYGIATEADFYRAPDSWVPVRTPFFRRNS
jgi:hypothetical protein